LGKQNSPLDINIVYFDTSARILFFFFAANVNITSITSDKLYCSFSMFLIMLVPYLLTQNINLRLQHLKTRYYPPTDASKLSTGNDIAAECAATTAV